MRCFGLPLIPIAEPVDGPWATAAAGHRRRRRSGRGGRDVHPRRGRPGAQHVARGRPRGGCALRQDPPVRRLRVPRVRHRRAGDGAGDDHGRRRRGRPDDLLRRAVPRPLHDAGRARGADHLRRGLLGRRPGQGRAVAAADPGARPGQHHLRGRGRPGGSGGRPVRSSGGARPPGSATARPSPRAARCWTSWVRNAGCSSPSSTSTRSRRPEPRSRCSPTADSDGGNVHRRRFGC